jgi:hypothetical protein
MSRSTPPRAPWARPCRAQALIEFALVAPVLLVLTLGVADLGRVLYAGVVVQQAAREGARLGAGATPGSHVYLAAADCPPTESPCYGIRDYVLYALGACPGCASAIGVVGDEPVVRVGGYNADGARFGSVAGEGTDAVCSVPPCSGGLLRVEVVWEVPLWSGFLTSLLGFGSYTVRGAASAMLV